MSNFKDELRKEFLSKELDNNQINMLQQISRKKTRKPMTFGAIAVGLIVLFYMFNPLKPLNIKVASEVAYNHLKNSSVQIETTSFIKVGAFLDKLDFSVSDSNKLSEYRLVGARYCSVQGKIAAQLKLMNSDGQRFTLYQYKPKHLLTDQTVEVDQTFLQIWSEGDIQFVLARK